MMKKWSGLHLINLLCNISPLSYGLVAYNYLKSLQKWQPALFNIGDDSRLPKEQFIIEALERAYFFNYYAPCVKIFHQFKMGEFVGRGERIGMPIFEMDRFTPSEKHHMNSLDRAVVNSHWAKEIVCNETNLDDTLVGVSPLGVDTEIFKPIKVNKFDDELRLFNIGKWEVRKGHDILLQAFNKAFFKTDNVSLHMLCDNPFGGNEEWEKYYKESVLGDKIQIYPRMKTQNDVNTFINHCDVGVFPSRAEGWNLDLIESMAAGKPVVATNYSAHTEFCNSDNSILLEPAGKEDAFDGKWFGKGLYNTGKWAKIEVDDLVDILRDIYKNRPEKNDAGIETADKFSWNNSAQTLVDFVRK